MRQPYGLGKFCFLDLIAWLVVLATAAFQVALRQAGDSPPSSARGSGAAVLPTARSALAALPSIALVFADATQPTVDLPTDPEATLHITPTQNIDTPTIALVTGAVICGRQFNGASAPDRALATIHACAPARDATPLQFLSENQNLHPFLMDGNAPVAASYAVNVNP